MRIFLSSLILGVLLLFAPVANATVYNYSITGSGLIGPNQESWAFSVDVPSTFSRLVGTNPPYPATNYSFFYNGGQQNPAGLSFGFAQNSNGSSQLNLYFNNPDQVTFTTIGTMATFTPTPNQSPGATYSAGTYDLFAGTYNLQDVTFLVNGGTLTGGGSLVIGSNSQNSLSVTPEPSTLVLFGTGLLVLMGWAVRKKKALQF